MCNSAPMMMPIFSVHMRVVFRMLLSQYTPNIMKYTSLMIKTLTAYNQWYLSERMSHDGALTYCQTSSET